MTIAPDLFAAAFLRDHPSETGSPYSQNPGAALTLAVVKAQRPDPYSGYLTRVQLDCLRFEGRL